MFNKRILIKIFIIILAIFAALEAAGYYIGRRSISKAGITTEGKYNKISSEALMARNSILRQKLKNLTPDKIYIVIDTGMNRLYLKKGNMVIHEAVVSSGSGNILKDPTGNRQWVFDTPTGEYTVKSKSIAPAWTKPDWAFIEEGEEIPKDPSKRVEKGVLGEYALGFGNGYFIHGTLYTRMLGRNVSHGCIRVGDKDLKTVFTAAAIGTRIYIF
ncbi:MAG: L,D-transpeptidase [Desulfobacteraceae bacterium]|jgi:L,D-transpeptidase YbiS|nr:MAG: L,D-transpeptidase [Desulfobacteraceae bacterium]